jgi:hypothetical protein
MRHLLIFLFLLIAPSWSQNPPPRPAPKAAVSRPPNQKSEGTLRQTSDEQRGSEQAPFVIRVLSSDNARHEPQANNEKGIGNPNKSWGLSDKIAAIAIVVGFLQFVALVWTVLVMIFNGRRQLRAYVLGENAGISEGSTVTPPNPAYANIPGVGMLIKNGGQTPAYHVISSMYIAVILVAQEDVALVVPPIPQQFSLTLGSGSNFTKLLWFDRQLTAGEIADIATGTRAIYLYGRIQYRDAFKKARYTNFRLRYTGQFPPPPNAMFWFCDKGNDAN